MGAIEIDRRVFLSCAGAATAWWLLPSPSTAGLGGDDPPPARPGKVLVLIYLRGGVDGLHLVVPFGDPGYASLRPSLALGAPSRGGDTLDLDGYFGLHPRAAALAPLLADGTAACVHAVGSPHVTRSHFEDQDWSETLVLESDVSTEGFLNRHLATTSGGGVVRGLALGDGLPRSLRGEARAYVIAGLDDLLPGGARGGDALLATLRKAYGGDAGAAGGAARLLGDGGEAALEVLRELQAVAALPDRSQVVYPETGLGPRLREAARLIRAGIGIEVIALDHGSFDTHRDQGGAQGDFGELVAGLAEPLAAFARDLEERLDDVLVLTLTEFGRTAAENGTLGTDHGWASCALALGGPVRAAARARRGPVIGTWPGLDRDALHERRDLAHTTDVRDLLAEAIGTHLGNKRLELVLPGFAPAAVGIVGA